jgi:thiosulfate/3-mercaptopyruvate sulfurtransferase
MTKTILPIIEATDLLQLYKTENLLIFDVSNGKNAQSNYAEKHLEGAIFVDLNTQLAEIQADLAIGGRHPLPQIENFAKTLANLGVSPQSHVILYDDKNGANAAARFWWMLKAIGHEKVQVLNGGFQAAVKANFPTSSKIALIPTSEPYEISEWQLPLADILEVEKVAENEEYLVIDVREPARYRGEYEQIDSVAGHIPGAINVPFVENLAENGLFLPPNELKKKYEKLFGTLKNENIIVHCGSGVTACHTLLAIAYAGLEIPKLYVGSWSEWSRKF